MEKRDAPGVRPTHGDSISSEPKRRPPFYVWAAWGMVILDLVGFILVIGEWKWGSPHGEAALGCMGITMYSFLPLLAIAGLLTILWKRGLWRQSQEKLAFQAKVRQVRKAHRQEEERDSSTS